MKYTNNDEPADLEAAYRWIEQAGYGYALDPIKAYIAELEQPRFKDFNAAIERNAQLQVENERLHFSLRFANAKIRNLNYKLNQEAT